MTDEHVWVTLADGKRLYVGKRLEPKLDEKSFLAQLDEMVKPKRKRRQNPPAAPMETLHAD